MKETKQYQIGDLIIANPATIDFSVVNVERATGIIIMKSRDGGYIVKWDNGSECTVNWWDHELLSPPIINRLGVLMLLKD